MKKISLAFSTCPNDTFMMYAIANKKIDFYGLEFEINMLDIEKLNRATLNNKFDVTKASSAIYKHVIGNYSILSSGAAFGIEGGPLFIKRSNVELNQNSIVALPGEYTSANALFDLLYRQKFVKKYVLFSDIFALLASERVDAGVVIHEDRFTYWQHGFEFISDLGLEWKKLNDIPIPLGIFLAKNKLGYENIEKINLIIKNSIKFAENNYDEVFEWIREFSRNEHPDVIKKHIEYYVNDFSFDIGTDGKKAIDILNDFQIYTKPF